MTEPRFMALEFARYPTEAIVRRAREFHGAMARRRTTRHFSTESVPREAIELAIRTAGTAPSGAHQQPWTFVAISDPGLKQQIRDLGIARAPAEREGVSDSAGWVSGV